MVALASIVAHVRRGRGGARQTPTNPDSRHATKTQVGRGELLPHSLCDTEITPCKMCRSFVDVEPLGHQARQKNEEFYERRAQIIDRFTREFSEEFCAENGQTNWQKIIQLNPQARTKKAA